jgi:NADPH2:quinone reductase
MTKAFRFHKAGGPEVMQWVDVNVPPPGDGQIRIRHTAIAVNFRDVLVRQGVHAAAAMPSGLGIEGSGVVEAIGPGVTEVAIGVRVTCVTGPDGAYAEARNVPANRVVSLPDNIDDLTAAAMMVRGSTARYLLHATYKVKPDDTILVHAAAGALGRILCQWAKHLGATVIGTVGSDEKAAVARAHGCDHAIVTPREDFVARVKEITRGDGVPVVYDSVGLATFKGSMQSLRRFGILASYGEASGDPDPVPPRSLGAAGSIFLTHPRLSDYTATREELMTTCNNLFAMVGSGKIKIAIDRTYPLREAPQAHADLEARRTTGAIVLIP